MQIKLLIQLPRRLRESRRYRPGERHRQFARITAVLLLSSRIGQGDESARFLFTETNFSGGAKGDRAVLSVLRNSLGQKGGGECKVEEGVKIGDKAEREAAESVAPAVLQTSHLRASQSGPRKAEGVCGGGEGVFSSNDDHVS